MPGEFFKPLVDYLKVLQQEWLSGKKPRGKDELEDEQEASYEAGMQAMQHEQFDEAVELLKKATQSRRYRKDAYYHLAECYQHLQMAALARKTYERLIRLDYHFKDVHKRIRALEAPKRKMPPRQSTPAPATTVSMSSADRYEMLSTIHEGKHTRIYRVRDTILGRIVALKQIDHHYPDCAGYLQQMKERTALKHPNILRVYDIDEQKGQVSMEYVEGRNLRYMLGLKERLSHKMVIHIAIQLVNGLHHAHSKKIVHHVLTPEHILLTHQCHVKITAFRAPDSFAHLQKTKRAYNYLYVPPEVLKGGTLTTASNIYSFGIILYEMFVKHTPFRLRQFKAFFHHQEPLEYERRVLPNGIQPIISRCLAVEPGARYPKIHSAGEDLMRWFQAQQQGAAHEHDLAAYKDYLLVAWADGRISTEEAAFLSNKRQELHITEQEAKIAESDVKQELKALLQNIGKM